MSAEEEKGSKDDGFAAATETEKSLSRRMFDKYDFDK
jgi:hypothetical protein